MAPNGMKIRDLVGVIFGVVLGALLSSMIQLTRCSTPVMEPFIGANWQTTQTVAVRTLASTRFARCQLHTVKTEKGHIVDNWLWMDESPHINVLVHMAAENKFMLFRQRKYGLDREYLSVLGGMFERDESAMQCARRELLEVRGKNVTCVCASQEYERGVFHSFACRTDNLHARTGRR
jgi:hypothetical protein